LCEKTRSIINQIDWDCELKTNYKKKNQGCKVGVSSGISWFFENVEEGIILEDDCLPNSTFFTFCEAMLKKYKNDKRIMHIGGTNFQEGRERGDGSYYFSKYVHVWGWATWRRAWSLYDVRIESFPTYLSHKYHEQLFSKKEYDYWNKYFQKVYNNELDTWDYQWFYTNLINNGLSIIPNKNLVSDLGFGEMATHTTQNIHPMANMEMLEMNIISDPTFMIRNDAADKFSFDHHFSPPFIQKLNNFIVSKINQKR
jgi:hypothetical protein